MEVKKGKKGLKLYGLPESDFDDLVRDSAHDPETKLIKGELISALHDAIQNLPNKQKQCIEFSALLGLSNSEIADELGYRVSFMTAAMLDRLTHHCEIHQFTCDRIRFKESLGRKGGNKTINKN